MSKLVVVKREHEMSRLAKQRENMIGEDWWFYNMCNKYEYEEDVCVH